MTHRLTRVQIAAAAAFWLAVSVLYAAQVWWLATRPGETVSLTSALIWTGGDYLAWMPLTLIVWRWSSTWWPATLGWPRYLGQHLILGAVMAVIHIAIVMGSAIALLGKPPGEAFSQLVITQLRSRAYFELIIYAGV